MIKIPEENKAGLYITVILHLAVIIILLVCGINSNLKAENSFVLDFSKYEEVERLKRELALQKSIKAKLEAELGAASSQSEVRNVAVDRSALKDDRGTNAEELYKDAERLRKELSGGFTPSEDDVAEPSPKAAEKKDDSARSAYRGPSVVSYLLDGRKASKLPIPAYRCLGAGEVTVLITVNPSGAVINAKVDEQNSSTDACLRAYAIRAARLSKFSAKADAAPKQIGNIVYKFIAQQ